MAYCAAMVAAKKPGMKTDFAVLLAVAFLPPTLFALYFALYFEPHAGNRLGFLALGVLAVAVMMCGVVLMTMSTQWHTHEAVAFGAAALTYVVVTFAYVYYAIGTAKNFGEHLSKTSALYFTIATLTSTGYGDITPRSDAARLVTSTQMLLDIVLLGVVLVLLVNRVAEARSRAQ